METAASFEARKAPSSYPANSNQPTPAPDTEPDEWPTIAGAGARVGYRPTPLSKVGTVCVRSASTVLCGGCRATGIPTATLASG